MSVRAEAAPQKIDLRLKQVIRSNGEGPKTLTAANLREYTVPGKAPTSERAPFGMRPIKEGVPTADRAVVYSVVKQGRDVDLSSPLKVEDSETAWKTTPQGKGEDPKVDSV